MNEKDRPVIVCLCGSARFKNAFIDANLRETLFGNIVLTIDCDMRHDDWTEEHKEIKRRLDGLQFRKIELADEVFILRPLRYCPFPVWAGFS